MEPPDVVSTASHEKGFPAKNLRLVNTLPQRRVFLFCSFLLSVNSYVKRQERAHAPLISSTHRPLFTAAYSRRVPEVFASITFNEFPTDLPAR